MKRFIKYTSLSAALIVLWTVMIFLGTDQGWWHTPFTEQKESTKFIASVHKELKKEFVGNMAMAIFKDGASVTESFHSKNTSVNRNTVFQVASLSKFISAIGVMRLVQEGKLDLDVPVSNYLKRWELPPSSFDNNKVTVRRLLSHTAGLTDGLGYSGFENLKDVQSLESSLTKAKDADQGRNGSTQVGIFPGSEWRYSGGGFTLLQLIVEEVSRQSFDQYMRIEIFEPLGMQSSFYQWDEKFRNKLCDFYNADGSKAPHFYYTSLAATSLYTTLTDLEKLFALFNIEKSTLKPLQPKYQRMMWQAEANKLGAPIYGLGTFLFAEIDNGQFIIGHDGQSNPPINTAFRYNPTNGDGIIILTTGNSNFATRIASDWVFLNTGKVDTLLFAMQQNKMVSNVIIGSVVIILLIITISLSRKYYKRKV
ncbi:beta-lactamase family protein [Aquimarina sp. MMG015]|uniref:serine hydrolase domain-containing protein n=1 Tax=Aquimarina sp. MMG015 TaxID=2822689 RepID=UPI001B39D5EA|nr:serine hydrolase domain-containing protein [Aquimarina sp. MMG015]MBQ4804565.1 beta-lactamase family protein [Aquimarina sp. MMG015]